MIWNNIVILVYFVLMALLCLYGIHRYYLMYLYCKYYKNRSRLPQYEWQDKPFPFITIQLPIFNEVYVVERLIDSVCRMDYPAEQLEIHVLDDSSDDTQIIAQRKIEEWQNKGINIIYHHRDKREGFKAGALAKGLEFAKGEFIVIFDADFSPSADFIKKLLPYFKDEKIGMVQARWEHINENYSFLTKLQAIFLDAHFIIEQTARNRSGKFFNFNGTAGMWRKQAIIDGGGWQQDTLTEDLDLSYRAQLAGWKFLFIPEVVCPAELPVEISAFKTQQRRWGKGAVQTGKKMLPKIWKSQLPVSVKLEATMHLFAHLGYLAMFILSLIIVPSVWIIGGFNWKKFLMLELPIFLISTVPVARYFIFSQSEVNSLRETTKKKVNMLFYAPSLIAMGIGISLSNAIAVFEAIANKKTAFQRTAKYRIECKKDRWSDKYYRAKFNVLPFIEFFLALYLGVGIWHAFITHSWGLLPFLLLFFFGFSSVGTLSLMHSAKR